MDSDASLMPSTLIKNLIMHQMPRFKEVYLIHEDWEFTKEYNDLEVTGKMGEPPDISFWDYDGPYIKRAVIVDDLEMTSAHKERMKIWQEEEALMDDQASVETFDSALEEESRVESSKEMLAKIDWVERKWVLRTLQPIGNLSDNLQGFDPEKVKDKVYLERIIKHE